jgi:phage/plasmid-associated DNA primase
MACNKLPNISEMDGGVTRRLKLTEFTSRFVENPDPENLKKGIHEFKIDKELKTKLENHGPVFMNILIKYYRKYREEGLKPPQSVISVTRKYEANNNMIKQFIDEMIVTGTPKDFLVKDELKALFNKDYVLKSHFNQFGNFLVQLETALFSEFKLDQKKKIFKLNGYYIRRPDEDDEADDEL